MNFPKAENRKNGAKNYLYGSYKFYIHNLQNSVIIEINEFSNFKKLYFASI